MGSEIRKARPLPDRLAGRVESESADGHRGADDDGRARLPVACAVSLSAPAGLRCGRSDSDGGHAPADETSGAARRGDRDGRAADAERDVPRAMTGSRTCEPWNRTQDGARQAQSRQSQTVGAGARTPRIPSASAGSGAGGPRRGRRAQGARPDPAGAGPGRQSAGAAGALLLRLHPAHPATRGEGDGEGSGRHTRARGPVIGRPSPRRGFPRRTGSCMSGIWMPPMPWPPTRTT